MGTANYRGKDYVTMSFNSACLVFDERAARNEHVAVMDAHAYGGDEGQYFIIPAKMKEGFDERTEKLED